MSRGLEPSRAKPTPEAPWLRRDPSLRTWGIPAILAAWRAAFLSTRAAALQLHFRQPLHSLSVRRSQAAPLPLGEIVLVPMAYPIITPKVLASALCSAKLTQRRANALSILVFISY